MATTAADVLIDTIYDWGVEVIFGLPGDGINGLMEALRQRQDKIRFIQVRHEESAALMACGYAKYTGRLESVWQPQVRVACIYSMAGRASRKAGIIQMEAAEMKKWGDME